MTMLFYIHSSIFCFFSKSKKNNYLAQEKNEEKCQIEAGIIANETTLPIRKKIKETISSIFCPLMDEW